LTNGNTIEYAAVFIPYVGGTTGAKQIATGRRGRDFGRVPNVKKKRVGDPSEVRGEGGETGPNTKKTLLGRASILSESGGTVLYGANGRIFNQTKEKLNFLLEKSASKRNP